MDLLLEVNDLSVHRRRNSDWLEIVESVDIALPRGSSIGLVGESGCGKSQTLLALGGLLPRKTSRVGGTVRLDGKDIYGTERLRLSGWARRNVGVVFQDSASFLNPVMTVGSQVAEAVRLKTDLGRRAVRERAEELMELVDLRPVSRTFGSYPHQFSGGMRQRAGIAMALAGDPLLLLADEPTTALDTTVQREILALLISMQEKFDLSIVFVSHDMALVNEFCDYIAVMYSGRVVEMGRTSEVLSEPIHPYTSGLLNADPRLCTTLDQLRSLPGTVPEVGARPIGCNFQDRCSYVEERCSSDAAIAPIEVGVGRVVECWRAEK